MDRINRGSARRTFLSLSLKTVAMAAAIGAFPAKVWARFIKRFPVRTVEKNTFRFNPETGMIEWKTSSPEPYKLIVDGLVRKKKTFSYAEARSFEQITQVSDFHCVEGWSVADLKWSGFGFSEILKRVEIKPEAAFVVFHSLGETGHKPRGQKHYLESFSIDQLLDPQQECLLALDLNDAPLSHDHGAPLRVIAPYDLAYKSIKFVTRIEFTSVPKPGWWTLANPVYPIDAPVPKSRLRQKNSSPVAH